MSRNLRALGLALLAAMAMTAVAAQAASAHEFTSASNSTVLTATGTNHVFNANGVEIKCHAFFKGTQTGVAADTITVHPIYNNEAKTCETPIGKAQIDTKVCDYIFESDTVGGDAPVTVSCAAGHSIKITGTACTITVGSQTPGNGVTFANGVGDVNVTATATGIHYTTSGGLGCALPGLPLTGTNGTYTGTATVQGFLDLGTSGTQTNGFTYSEGPPTNISVDIE